MPAHEHKMHRALLIPLLSKHSGPCEHKLPQALRVLLLLSIDNKNGCIAHEHMYALHLNLNSHSQSSQFTTTAAEKTYKHLTLYFVSPSFLFHCAGFAATESIYFRWSLLDLQTDGPGSTQASRIKLHRFTEAEIMVVQTAD